MAFVERGLHLVRERHAVLAAGGIIDDDRMQTFRTWLVGVIENQGRAELADGGGAVPLGSRHLQHRFLVQIVAAEMLIGIDDNGIHLQKRRHGAVRRPDGITGVDRVGESHQCRRGSDRSPSQRRWRW